MCGGEGACEKNKEGEGEERTNVCDAMNVRRMRGREGAVEAVHARRMKGKGEEGEEDKCSWLKEACEKDEERGEREEERGQIREVERVHVRRMREEEGRTNVCSGDGACEEDEGGGGEDKCLQWRWCM